MMFENDIISRAYRIVTESVTNPSISDITNTIYSGKFTNGVKFPPTVEFIKNCYEVLNQCFFNNELPTDVKLLIENSDNSGNLYAGRAKPIFDEKQKELLIVNWH